MIRIQTPLSDRTISGLKAGDRVLISGPAYGARDAAHKKLAELIEKGADLPLDPAGKLIYYTGPSPAPPGRIIGACGPTTSSRMDIFTPALLRLGLKGTMGKGPRSDETRDAIKKHKAVYFSAAGGLGALLSKRIAKAEIIAFEEFGPEALWEFYLREFPALVAIDSSGRDFYRDMLKI